MGNRFYSKKPKALVQDTPKKGDMKKFLNLFNSMQALDINATPEMRNKCVENYFKMHEIGLKYDYEDFNELEATAQFGGVGNRIAVYTLLLSNHLEKLEPMGKRGFIMLLKSHCIESLELLDKHNMINFAVIRKPLHWATTYRFPFMSRLLTICIKHEEVKLDEVDARQDTFIHADLLYNFPREELLQIGELTFRIQKEFPNLLTIKNAAMKTPIQSMVAIDMINAILCYPFPNPEFTFGLLEVMLLRILTENKLIVGFLAALNQIMARLPALKVNMFRQKDNKNRMPIERFLDNFMNKCPTNQHARLAYSNEAKKCFSYLGEVMGLFYVSEMRQLETHFLGEMDKNPELYKYLIPTCVRVVEKVAEVVLESLVRTPFAKVFHKSIVAYL
jgi:hypothetical protein